MISVKIVNIFAPAITDNRSKEPRLTMMDLCSGGSVTLSEYVSPLSTGYLNSLLIRLILY